ncbi:SpoIIE family protein phosphatase, partial [Myxococcota bacterium]|nr:SpoIIE family protein phosphatase [Myxococcota bacterium]
AMRWLTDLGSQTIMQITRGSSSGTTLVVGCVAGGHLLIANTGDSRAYLFRQGKVRALTDDHTVAAAHMRAGRITKEEHDASPYQHMLYQALGTQSELDPDIFDEPAAVGDVLLVCSDGLTGPVSEDNIARILNEHSNLDRAAAALIQAANDNGGPDNITVVLTRITSGGDPATLEEERRLFLGCPLLSTLSDTERRQLRHYVDREAFEADAPFNNPEAFYLLLSGKARRPDGREAGPGDVVGLRRFAGAEEAAVEVATEPCVALRLSLGAYDTLERQRPTIAARMMRQLLTLMARGVA